MIIKGQDNQMKSTDFHRETVEPILSREQFVKISDSLSALAVKLRVEAMLLVNTSGRIIASNIRTGWQGDTTLLSTLAASSFSAANEMGRILGEREQFKMVLHEGEKRNIFVSTVTSNYFLIVVFEKGVALGMVRLFTKKTIIDLVPILEDETRNLAAENIFDGHFSSLLDDELDRSLTEFS